MKSGHRRLYYYCRKKVSPSSLSQMKKKTLKWYQCIQRASETTIVAIISHFIFSVFHLTHNGRSNFVDIFVAGDVVRCAIATLNISRRSLYKQNICFVIFQSIAVITKLFVLFRVQRQHIGTKGSSPSSEMKLPTSTMRCFCHTRSFLCSSNNKLQSDSSDE